VGEVPLSCPGCDGVVRFVGCQTAGLTGGECVFSCPAVPASCDNLSEADCKARGDCTANYCSACTGGSSYVGCTGANEGRIECGAGACPPPALPVCSGDPRGGHEVPTEHRPVAVACAPSSRSPAAPDGGAPSCTTDADCANDAGSLFTTCLHGRCSFDHCLSDDDCGGNGVCSCANSYYGGNASYHANVCVPSGCHVDSDCGPNGFCSPSVGTCGYVTGYQCHGPADSCVDAAKDCVGCGNSCVYSPEAGGFGCGSSLCNG
jgi:hypothetical protein